MKDYSLSDCLFYLGDEITLQEPVDLYAIVSGALRGGYYNYRGSLTTPNCTESVTWNVFKTNLMVSQAEVSYCEFTFLSLSTGINNFS